MKIEKLELLLNKVVEFNKPNEIYVKGFLYKDNYSGEYYLKIVETLLGSLTFNQKHYLKNCDDEFIKQADKPKLMRVSLKSWHYRLIKYVLRDSAPTPKTMQNGCPYFWILMFSMLVVPFILLGKGILWIALLIPQILFWVLEQMVINWIENLDDETAYEMDYYGMQRGKVPKTAQIFFNNSQDNFFELFLSKKHNVKTTDSNYAEKRAEIRAKWELWRNEQDKKRDEERKVQTEKEAMEYNRRRIQEAKREEARILWEARMRPIKEGFNDIGAWFKKTFTVERGRVNAIVKGTKQVVGALVTVLILFVTGFLVNYISLGLMWLIDLCISNWIILVGVVGAFAIMGLVYLIYILLSSWVQTILNKYECGKKVWYVQPFIYAIFYPLKYLFMAIAFIVVKILWEIVKFIFYTAIFKNFFKPIGLFIAKLAVGLWNGIVGSTGVFGEYFGASYSDYCPGIEWCDIEEEEPIV